MEDHELVTDLEDNEVDMAVKSIEREQREAAKKAM